MLDFLKQITRAGGRLALKYYQAGVVHKYKSNPSDLVTIADTLTDKFLVEKIIRKYPNHGIISEEMNEVINPDAEYVWVIDPIDGTRNFANHIPFWCTMVGVTKNNVPYLGAIYDALHDQLYYAEKNKGAFLNGKRIRVNKKNEVAHSFLNFSPGERIPGSPYYAKEYPRYLKYMNRLMGRQGFWINNYGSMLSICHLAEGGLDAMMMCSGLYHDYLAAYIIATEAGAKFTDSYGKPWKKGKMDIVVANPKLHKNLMKLF